MTRTIKASEVKPGMEVEIITRMKIRMNTMWVNSHRVMRDDAGHVARIDADTPVTVLSEAQPEEPTTFGARVILNGAKVVRAGEVEDDDTPWLEEGSGYWRTWDQVCADGHVTVIPDQGWTVPADTPEVPERIEEWPENDEVLRAYLWMDSQGNKWQHGFIGLDNGWSAGGALAWKNPLYGPWTRVTDA